MFCDPESHIGGAGAGVRSSTLLAAQNSGATEGDESDSEISVVRQLRRVGGLSDV